MNDLNNIPLIIILGPTAVGKSTCAFELAQRFGLEIINADSMQVYRGMDIGSAKPSPHERELVPHHLIDIRNPDEEFRAAQFRDEAHNIIVSLFQQGKQSLVVGGTGLYIRVLTRGLFPAPPADPGLRAELKKKEEREGKGYLHGELEKVDPEAALRIHPNDTFRTIRALEIFYLTGTSISRQHQDHQFKECHFKVLKIGLLRDREALYHRIEERVDTMLSSGLLEEVQRLLKKGYAPTIKPFYSLGYKQIVGYLQGTTSLEEAVQIIKRNTKRYAKRQLTWFRKDTEIEWFTLPRQYHEIGEAVRKFLKI